MYRILVFGFLCCLIPVPAIAQPTGGQTVCQISVAQNCQVIAGVGGRCIFSPHSCSYVVVGSRWVCAPSEGIDMVDSTTYMRKVPAVLTEAGYLHWVNQASFPCGFKETCKCDPITHAFCFDDARVPWGPGNDLPDPGVYGIPPISDCFGVY
jgi:hypothetical protein